MVEKDQCTCPCIFCAAHTTYSNCNRKEHVSRPGLQHIHAYHKYLDQPTIYRTRPSSSGHEA
eukprot:679733-Pelagomonas_calceolata.AAC.1